MFHVLSIMARNHILLTVVSGYVTVGTHKVLSWVTPDGNEKAQQRFLVTIQTNLLRCWCSRWFCLCWSCALCHGTVSGHPRPDEEPASNHHNASQGYPHDSQSPRRIRVAGEKLTKPRQVRLTCRLDGKDQGTIVECGSQYNEHGGKAVGSDIVVYPARKLDRQSKQQQ